MLTLNSYKTKASPVQGADICDRRSLGSTFGGAGAKRLRGLQFILIRAEGTLTLFTIHRSLFIIHLKQLPSAGGQ